MIFSMFQLLHFHWTTAKLIFNHENIHSPTHQLYPLSSKPFRVVQSFLFFEIFLLVSDIPLSLCSKRFNSNFACVIELTSVKIFLVPSCHQSVGLAFCIFGFISKIFCPRQVILCSHVCSNEEFSQFSTICVTFAIWQMWGALILYGVLIKVRTDNKYIFMCYLYCNETRSCVF